jgi:hypothetical protein
MSSLSSVIIQRLTCQFSAIACGSSREFRKHEIRCHLIATSPVPRPGLDSVFGRFVNHADLFNEHARSVEAPFSNHEFRIRSPRIGNIVIGGSASRDHPDCPIILACSVPIQSFPNVTNFPCSCSGGFALASIGAGQCAEFPRGMVTHSVCDMEGVVHLASSLLVLASRQDMVL